jgi:hypothetical protein
MAMRVRARRRWCGRRRVVPVGVHRRRSAGRTDVQWCCARDRVGRRGNREVESMGPVQVVLNGSMDVKGVHGGAPGVVGGNAGLWAGWEHGGRTGALAQTNAPRPLDTDAKGTKRPLDGGATETLGRLVRDGRGGERAGARGFKRGWGFETGTTGRPHPVRSTASRGCHLQCQS